MQTALAEPPVQKHAVGQEVAFDVRGVALASGSTRFLRRGLEILQVLDDAFSTLAENGGSSGHHRNQHEI